MIFILNHGLDYKAAILELSSDAQFTAEQNDLLWAAAFSVPCISDEFANSSFKLIAIRTYELINGVTVDKSIIGWLSSVGTSAVVPNGWTTIKYYYDTMKNYFEESIQSAQLQETSENDNSQSDE